MQLHTLIADLRDNRIKAGKPPVPNSFQGVTKRQIRQVLSMIDLGSNAELVDVVFALLDDETASWFFRAPHGSTFSSGASTAHLACHVGILQRGGSKLDREGRDYWIKPLRDLGGLDAVFLDSNTNQFIPGHPIPKSPNSSYKLSDSFKRILQAPEDQWRSLLQEWIGADAARKRKELQALLAEKSRAQVDSKHSDLISSSIDYYVPNFLPGFEVFYVDDGDGDRITDEDRALLLIAGIEIKLGDAMPDVLLWSRGSDCLWVITN